LSRDLRVVLDAVLDGIVVVDAEGRVEQMNIEACRILGVSSDASRARPLATLAGGPVLSRLADAALRRGISATDNEIQVERPFQPPAVLDVAAAPLLDELGRIDGAVVLLRDRTLGNALRDLWTERERLADLGRIAAGIAHEVKNPLGGIRGAAELIAARSETAKTRETAELIVREVDRISSLVEDLMTFCRSDRLRPSPVNLHRVLDDVLDLLAMDPLGTRAKLERRYDPSIPEILADPDRLAQVFLNLGRNALEALASEGGTLAITTRMSLDHQLDPLGGERVPGVVIEFEDTGRGIPPELLDRVTIPFFTTKVKGSGLGLALAQHFVGLHGGRLQLQAGAERGTRARVTLPLRKAP
jgi:two-component system nitrogen regulation sensor histidine kinase GlnL